MEILLQTAYSPCPDNSVCAERRSDSAQNKANRQSFDEQTATAKVEPSLSAPEPDVVEALNPMDQNTLFRSNTAEASARFYPEMKNQRAFAAIQTFENIRHFAPSDFIVDTFA